MIDLHSHILPGIDDGAKDIDMSLSMLATAEADGIATIVASPHFIPGAFAPTADEVRAAAAALDDRARAEGIRIAISLAHEVRAGAGLVEKVKTGEVLAYDPKRRYLLLEMPGSGVPSWMDRLLFELEVSDITPVLAHPERNLGVIKNPMLLYDLVEKGCRVQVTAGSITGRFGTKAQETAILLLKHDMVHAVASDAHDSVDRVPALSRARLATDGILGPARSADLYERNPAAILRGDDFYAPDPKAIKEEERITILSLFRKLLGNHDR